MTELPSLYDFSEAKDDFGVDDNQEVATDDLKEITKIDPDSRYIFQCYYFNILISRINDQY